LVEKKFKHVGGDIKDDVHDLTNSKVVDECARVKTANSFRLVNAAGSSFKRTVGLFLLKFWHPNVFFIKLHHLGSVTLKYTVV